MKKKEKLEKKSMDVDYAYCGVDNTKCEGFCREKSTEHGVVYCSEVIGKDQALNKKDKVKRK